MLMCEVSKSIKDSLQSSVGVASAASFHALVSSQMDSSSGHVTQQVPAAGTGLLQPNRGDDMVRDSGASGGGSVGAEMSTFKAAASSNIAIQRMSMPNRFCLANRAAKFEFIF